MNFKKLSRSLVCLLLVACMLVAVSPIRAQATGIVETVTAVAVSNPLALLGAVIVGLGVVAAADHYDVFDNLTRECEMWMRNNTDFFTEDGVYVGAYKYGTHLEYYISEAFVQAVRDFLFTSGTLSVVPSIAGAEISALSVASGTGYNSLTKLVDSSPENTLALLQNIGINSNVLILSLSATTLCGLFFDEGGRLWSGSFTNPLGIVNASLLGMHPLSGLELIERTALSLGVHSTPTSYVYNGMIFFSEEYAKNYEGFLTSNCYAFNWERTPYTTVPLVGQKGAYFYFSFKDSSSTIFTSSAARYINLSGGNSCLGQFEWDTTIYQSVVSSIDVGLSLVAPSDKTLSEGYADWATGVITLPGSTTIPNQDEKDKYYPIDFPPDISDVFDMTQEQAQGGIKTETDSNVGTNSDPVTGTNLKSWLQSLKDSLAQWFSRLTLHVSNISDSIVNGFASLVSALANLPALIAGIFRALADHFKGIFLLGDLLVSIGEYILGLFSWLPPEAIPVVSLTFGIAAFYKFIGR